MANCKHGETVNGWYTTSFLTGTVGNDGHWRVRWCTRCREVIPWGPATMTPQVELEILAAEIADRGIERSMTHLWESVGVESYLAFRLGFHGNDDYDGDEEYIYAAGALARAIVEHDEEEP